MSEQIKKNKKLEAEIVAFLSKKDKRAISLLYKNYAPALYGIITRMIPSEEVAQEVLQDVFVKVWNNADKYDSSKGRLFTWLAQITRNAALDTFRSGKYQRSTKTETLEPTVYNNDRLFSENPNIKDAGLQKIVNNLDAKYRKVIDYVYFQGYSHSEAAKELDIPLGTLKSRVRIAIQMLRKVLGNELLSIVLLSIFFNR